MKKKLLIISLIAACNSQANIIWTQTGRLDTTTYSYGTATLDRSGVALVGPFLDSTQTSGLPGVGGGSAQLSYQGGPFGFTASGSAFATYSMSGAIGDSYADVWFMYSFTIDEPYSYSLSADSFQNHGRHGLAGVSFATWHSPLGYTFLSLGSGILQPGDYSFGLDAVTRGYSDPDYSETGWGVASFSASLNLATIPPTPPTVPDTSSTLLLLTIAFFGLLWHDQKS